MTAAGQILKTGQTVQTMHGMNCRIDSFLGGGGQGEVYKVQLGNQAMALKWYFHYAAVPEQRTALETLIRTGAPNDRFLWPIELAHAKGVPGFGYLMALREKHYCSIVDLMKRRTDPTFRALISAGLELADSFLQLHARGLCYRDISFGNIFFDPENGQVLICDNDNVAVDGACQAGVLGTPRFMAPEIVRGEACPTTQTDLFSLAVLLFYMLTISHPLEGRKETDIHCFDLPAMNKIYGSEPLFIFDPHDTTNRPVSGIHDNALAYWPLYPQYIRDLFTRAFTLGLTDPLKGRVRESEWRAALAQLRDWILYCPACGSENFYDPEVLKKQGQLALCWSCKTNIPLPYRLRIDRSVIMLNYDTKLYPHHLDPQRLYDFSAPLAEVVHHPTEAHLWGLKNLSAEKWVLISQDGVIKDIAPGRSVTLAGGQRIQFGAIEGEIRI
jgi:serine/threonine protein kinase